jgi:hypothetical protein
VSGQRDADAAPNVLFRLTDKLRSVALFGVIYSGNAPFPRAKKPSFAPNRAAPTSPTLLTWTIPHYFIRVRVVLVKLTSLGQVVTVISEYRRGMKYYAGLPWSLGRIFMNVASVHQTDCHRLVSYSERLSAPIVGARLSCGVSTVFSTRQPERAVS